MRIGKDALESNEILILWLDWIRQGFISAFDERFVNIEPRGRALRREK